MTVIRNTEQQDRLEATRREIRSLAAQNDIDELARLPREQLEHRRAQALERLETRQDRVFDENRDLSERENSLSKADMAETEALDMALFAQERNAAKVEHRREVDRAISDLFDTKGRVETRGRAQSLLVSEDHLRSHAEAIRQGSTFGAYEVEARAQVTVATDTGSPGSYGEGGIPNPITLRRFAGIPVDKLEGATAQHPSVTLPTGVAGVAETVAHTEFDGANVANLTALRYGRWTDVTSFVDEFTTLKAINGAHAVGLARDLNLVDLTAIQTAAGTVVAFDAANLDRNVRTAILKVAAAALVPPEAVVLFGTSAALGVVTGYAPASGDDRGTVATRIYGAKVYVTEQALAGNIYCFAPNGFQIFSTGLASASVIDPTTGGHKFGQWIHSTAPGVFIVGAAAGVDVVTP
jgi:hypothetical protein